MGRYGARFCPQGHDTQLLGRFKNGTCRSCAARKSGNPRGRPTAQLCLRGHDTSILGRTSSGTCRECNRAHGRRYKSGTLGGVPALRLRKKAGTREIAQAAWRRFRDCLDTSAYKMACNLWEADRIPVYLADDWCIALGTHLAIVYPEVYASEEPIPDLVSDAKASAAPTERIA